MKPGDKIYEIEYDNSPFKETNKRKILSYTIKKIENGFIYVQGTKWEIPIEDIGRQYFLSKRAAYEQAVRNNLIAAQTPGYDTEAIIDSCKEVIRLCKLIDKEVGE